MNIRKNAEGGGVFFLQVYLIMKTATFEGFVASLKNLRYNFPKMRGGIKDRLELFRKFTRFGGAMLPFAGRDIFIYNPSLDS